MLNTQELQQSDSTHYLHPFTDAKSLKKKGARVITRAEGIYLWDSDGNRLLDGMAGLWCVNVGYGRKVLAQTAMRQLEELPYYNTFFQTTHPPAVALSEKLAELSPPGFNRVFLVNSGSEANDTVLRMIRRYWALMDQPQRRVVISRINAYHGSTVASASMGGQSFIHKIDGLPIPEIEHIEEPYWYANGGDLTPEEYGLKTARALEEKILELGENRVAAFIGEPIQGAGGVIVPPENYWPEIQSICKKYGILLVADEVICGFGRLGEWFGSTYYNLDPDLMPIAKGLSSGYLPIGGVLVHDRVGDVLQEKGEEFSHGFTYSGHPASCSVALENLKIVENEKLVEKVKHETGPHLKERWQEFNSHPLVAEVRNAGLLGAIELSPDKSRRAPFPEPGKTGYLCRDICFKNGLVMRSVKDTMIISPPLIISKEQIDEMFELAWKCLDQTSEAL